MTLYRETFCEHGRFASHEVSDYHGHHIQAGTRMCPGGSREEVTIDHEAFHKALYEWHHSERPMSSDVEKELIDAALGVTEEE